MEVTKESRMATRELRDVWNRYMRSEILYLCGENEHCAYRSCSDRKWKAWNECRNLFVNLNGWRLRYIGVNQQVFTLGFMYEKDGVRMFMYITPSRRIECRVGQKSKDGNRYSVLLYKTARTDMDILDEVFGIDNWQVDYDMIGTMLFCTLSIWSEKRITWIRKSSNGTESMMEAEKGQASDALKRAGFMVGIGRELYSAPQIWLNKDVNAYDLKVEQIEYDGSDKICTLVLSAKGEVVYQFRNGKGVQKDKPAPTHEELERIRDIATKLEFEGKTTDEILAYYKVKTIGEIPLKTWEKMLAKARGEI